MIETGGSSGSGGVVGSGGVAGTGGTMTGAGGSETGVGGSQAGAGGTVAGSGGTRTRTGGIAAGGRSGTGGRSAAGGSSATGGSSVSTGGAGGLGGTTSLSTQGGAGGGSIPSRDAGSTGGRGGGGSGTGGSGGGGAGTGGASAGGGSGTSSPGCGTPITRPNPKTQQTMNIGGTTRYYLLDVPSGADNQTPLMLIFALHGYDMNNVSVVGLYNFTSRSNGKAITVYPQGEGPAPGDTSHWGDNVLKSTWNGNEANYNFIQALMTDLEERFCIDTSRVFITGFSMGGMFTNGIACAHNDWFRGYAPVEGMGPGSCSNANAKPAVIIHQGTGDTLVTPSSGGEPTRDFWIKQNGCSQTNTSSFTGCKTYSECAEPVVYCVGNWDHTINSTITGNVWSFFSGLP
ncbi:MAG: prolyl oligopeptidase family serine peptidase [Deltaproteobacteria bacterium]|nr:prolyl oligopeptidase family serine peptidase [Deltaproteobacteria bacterium]